MIEIEACGGKRAKIYFLLFTRELGSPEKDRKRDILIPRVLCSYSHPAQAWMDSWMVCPAVARTSQLLHKDEVRWQPLVSGDLWRLYKLFSK